MNRRRMTTIAAFVALLGAPSAAVRADDDSFRVNIPIDATVTGLAFAGGFLASLIPIRPDEAPIELGPGLAASRFSVRAAALSDSFRLAAITAPLAAQLGLHPLTDEFGRAALIYAEALGIDTLFVSLAKRLAQRPRPYVRHPSPEVARYARHEGDNARLSFYSGHASAAFTAAVAGSYLFGAASEESRASAALWGVEMALASATANLRVRAGRHYYGDVVAGALIGSAIGFLVPFIHERPGQRYAPRAEEWVAMGAGLVAGTVFSQLLTFRTEVPVLLDFGSAMPIPVPLAGGASLLWRGAL